MFIFKFCDSSTEFVISIVFIFMFLLGFMKTEVINRMREHALFDAADKSGSFQKLFGVYRRQHPCGLDR